MSNTEYFWLGFAAAFIGFAATGILLVWMMSRLEEK